MTTIDAIPYRWPWDGALSTSRLALVIAGAQRYWAVRTVDASAHLATVAALADRIRAIDVPVLWIRHGRLATSRVSVPQRDSDAWLFALEPCAGDIVVDAAGIDGCYGSALDANLRTLQRDHIVMCGLGLEGPVHSTLRSLNDRGLECLTLTDACAPHDSLSATGALSTITLSYGIFGAVARSASLLEALPRKEFAA